MSLLPSYAITGARQGGRIQAMKIPREYGIYFISGQPSGKIVEGLEAIRVWIWCCLKTERFRHPIYSWDYGVSMEQYIGGAYSKEYIETDCEAEIREALMINPYITGITDFKIQFSKDKLNISFLVETKFGRMEVIESV